MAGARRGAERDHRLADGERQRHSHASALPVSAIRAVQGNRQHRSGRKLHLPSAIGPDGGHWILDHVRFDVAPFGRSMSPEIGHDHPLTKLRLLQALLVLTIPLYVYAGEVLGPAKPKGIKRLGLFLVLLGALNIWYVLSGGRRAVAKASDLLRSRGDDALTMRR